MGIKLDRIHINGGREGYQDVFFNLELFQEFAAKEIEWRYGSSPNPYFHFGVVVNAGLDEKGRRVLFVSKQDIGGKMDYVELDNTDIKLKISSMRVPIRFAHRRELPCPMYYVDR